MAHRHAFERAHRPLLPGEVVCHKCDNGLCVNPGHLFAGSQSDNMKDAVAKGRLPTIKDQRGARNLNVKYDRELAERVREYHARHQCSYGALAAHFNLKSKGHAHKIVKRLIWV